MSALPPHNNYQVPIEHRNECLITNGAGSYANLSVTGGLSRSYHGLLIQATSPPMGRRLCWHSCIETVNGTSLDARQWIENNQRKCHNGHRFITAFDGGEIPTWHYNVDGNQIKKELLMEQGSNTTILKYTLISTSNSAPSIKLKLENYVHFREITSCRSSLSEQDIFNWRVQPSHQAIHFDDQVLRLSAQTPDANSKQKTEWFEPSLGNQISNLYYALEVEDQGYAVSDASLKVQQSTIELHVGECCYMVGTLEESWPFSTQAFQKKTQLTSCVYSDNRFANDLSHCAMQFMTRRQRHPENAIVAGYPWFGDWGRDTMISLPGIALTTGNFDLAKSILKSYAHFLNAGLLPNRFPTRAGESIDYDTIDASLWFFWAVQKYIEHTQDWAFLDNEIGQDLCDIIRHHIRGTRYGIGIDNDGLIKGGSPETKLTWMDACYNGKAITSRHGKAIEINALWYNALCFADECCQRLKKECQSFSYLIPKVKEQINLQFWNETQNACFDVINEQGRSDLIRCNQIIAISLPYSAFDEDRMTKIYNTVHEKLYTPKGLRTLAKEHTQYKGEYYGTLERRDQAYHQGTVWAWLMGPFIDATMKLKKDPEYAASLLEGLKQHFYTEAGIQGISEIFDGDAPHTARGCFNQAWSVAECLRVIHAYQLNVKDPNEKEVVLAPAVPGTYAISGNEN
ncbi:amylo-alpha-1,6-glucosidase [Reinekea marinisedimentorum]|uniref:Putative glycogen debranching enzyme n=1 Tax=Reinekea marinisedimentorum TaxID=230495 RepID=A0A4R3I7S8_9GAMM|nr:amylo-alpha-1,6-glucosidase [Reinekea marinisedimentorum]TCS41314.1 putative glycogen debranching enzyme [Reinekea marinisedimentorum]